MEWTRGIPQSNAGDMMMVRAWSGLGFVVKRSPDNSTAPLFYESERNDPLIANDPDGAAG